MARVDEAAIFCSLRLNLRPSTLKTTKQYAV